MTSLWSIIFRQGDGIVADVENYEHIAREAERKLADGAELETVIRYLRSSGLSKSQCVGVLIEMGRYSLREVKVAIHASPTWADVRPGDEEFLDDLVHYFDENLGRRSEGGEPT